MNPYDFHAFLNRMAQLDYPNILLEADDEVRRVESVSSRVRGSPKRREMGSLDYAHRIKAFLFYMRHGTRPGSADDNEFASYRPVVEALVKKGQFKPEALDAFRARGS